MKWYLIGFIVLLVGCQTATQPDSMQENAPDIMGDNEMDEQMDEHMGCQEGEIVDGQCEVSGDNNAGMFDQDVDQFVDTTELDGGYLAKPKQDGNYPGIVMIHEWWGLNENIEFMARLLAKEGYIVYAVDLYDGEVADASDRAGQLASAVRSNPGQAIAHMKAAVQYLKTQENVEHVASIGWCFGGQQSLLLSLNEDLDATVIYYGSLVTEPEELEGISGPVLGIFGSEDRSIPVSTVREFEDALDEMGVQNSIRIFQGVGHAFANPSGSNYAAEETMEAWAMTLAFLEAGLTGTDGMMDDGMMQDDTVTIRLEGVRYSFNQGQMENPTIRVKQGQTVRVEMEVTDGFHDWVIDEFDAGTEAVGEGQTTFVEFVADEKGTFEYYCSVGNHRALGMQGTLVVE